MSTNLSQFLAEQPLYEEIKFDAQQNSDLEEMLLQKGSSEQHIDTFCIHCDRETTFQFSTDYTIRTEFIMTYHLFREGDKQFFLLSYKCSRQPSHELLMVFRYSEGTFMKVGQYPSRADLDIAAFKQYAKVIEKEALRELTRAVGLAAHGVGIGAFVYLRRIVETLVEQARAKAEAAGNFDLDAYAKARFSDKIKILAAFLPPLLSQSPQLYSILSKGVHELSEQECLKAFPALRLAIEIILDEKEAERERNLKSSQLSKTLNTISSELK